MPDIILPGPAGRIEVRYQRQKAPNAPMALVLHPHPQFGGTMNNPLVYDLFHMYHKLGCTTVRFNFRGVGRSQGEYGELAGEIEDARAALRWLHRRYPDLPYTLAGFSFGARVITRMGCATPGALGLIATGFPTRFGPVDYLQSCAVPKVFVQSTHDAHGPRPELEALFATFSEPKRLMWVEAGDHFFAGALGVLEETVRGLGSEMLSAGGANRAGIPAASP